MTSALIAPVSATLMPMQTYTLWRILSYFWAPKFCPTKVVTETPKAPEIIQVRLSVLTYAVQAATATSPKELMPDWMSVLARSKVTNCSPAGTPM